MKIAKVKDAPGFVRDMDNKAIINTNESALIAYKKKRQKAQELNQSIDDINMLKNDVKEIKQLLVQLLQHRN
jgi:hypothetical protein